MPRQRQPLQRTRSAVGELSQQRVDQDGQHDDIDQHEFARLHCHVAEAGRSRDGFRDEIFEKCLKFAQAPKGVACENPVHLFADFRRISDGQRFSHVRRVALHTRQAACVSVRISFRLRLCLCHVVLL